MAAHILPGTTPTFQFTLPFDTSTIETGYITFVAKFGSDPFLEKSMDDCTLEGNVISFRLTQEETLAIPQSSEFKIQITVKSATGDRLTSNIINVTTGKILKDEVI